MDTLNVAVSLIVKSMVLSARWAGRLRLGYLKAVSGIQAGGSGIEGDMTLLRAEVERLKSQVEILKGRLAELGSRKPY